MHVETLVSQHRAMLDIVDRILGLRPDKDAPAIAAELGKLGVTLLAHLEAEDRDLYPALRRCGEQPGAPVSLKTQIKTFFDEMEALKPSALAFLSTWTAAEIQARPAEFQAAIEGIAEVLSQRIAREESRLYPLYTEHVAAAVGR